MSTGGGWTIAGVQEFRDALIALNPVYGALFDGNPTTTGVEATGGSYARKPLSFQYMATISLELSNTVAERTFDVPAGFTVAAFGIFDSSTGGNLLMWDGFPPRGPYGADGRILIDSGGIGFSYVKAG